MGKSTDKVAFVTGGNRGIGRGIALGLASTGVSVALTYSEKNDLAEDVVREIVRSGGEALAIQVLLEDRASIRKALGITRKQLGPIDILVNNAAISQEIPFDTITDADWDRMLTVNLRGAFICCQEVLPNMLEKNWGRIINITSIGGQWGGYNQVHYAVSKAGLISLTKSVAKIYSKFGITANAVSPGLVNTDMSADELNTEAGREKVRNIPVGRIATVEEIAGAVVFLSGESASYITGQTINVNGGMYSG